MKPSAVQLGRVISESGDEQSVVVDVGSVDTIHADLSAGADITSVQKLNANRGMCANGVALQGDRI